jgi:hypothetical protein
MPRALKYDGVVYRGMEPLFGGFATGTETGTPEGNRASLPIGMRPRKSYAIGFKPETTTS